MYVIICTWRMGASNLKLILISSTWDYTIGHNFLPMFKKIILFKKNPSYTAQKTQHGEADALVSNWAMKHFDFQKLASLWLAGEMVNHVGIYGSKAAEGLSAFQRQSYLICNTFIQQNI